MKKKFTVLLMKRLVRKIVKILHLGRIDSLGRMHVYMKYGKYLCHITLVDCFGSELFPACGLFIKLYERADGVGIRQLAYWQLPNSVSAVKLENLRHIGLNAIQSVTRKIITVVGLGTIISKENIVQV